MADISELVPASIGDLSVEVLNALLEDSDKWNNPLFESIEISVPHGAIDGMSNAVWRIDGILASGLKTSLIVKFRDKGGAKSADQGGMNEVLFYSELADIAGVESPESYVSLYDNDSRKMIIVLEHLDCGGSIGSIQTYLDVPEVERIVLALAGMHAKWWNSPELAALSQVRTFEEVISGGAKLFASGHFSGKRFISQYGDRLHPDIFRMYDTAGQWGPRLQAGFSANRTLCNYDVAAKNLFLPTDTSKPPIFFDWSLLTRGSIGVELAVVLAYCLRVEDHDKFQAILVAYLDKMCELGVANLSMEILWNEFRHGLLVRMAAPIALTTRDYPPAHDLALEILPRITSAVLESSALELLS
ncbi:hypothetical protein GKN94_09065 [Candidatus Lucifugimonas marina]|uniref:hypothetical protein n=1 Tax=Candidatus Lucifugimonas marina TaxID=3038979 RepID=UPI00279F33A7|nr:hypothetical protein GKN94_09065 [SAR202 cluster bacterium JH545]